MISSLTNKGELLMETLEQRTELFHKERELEFKQAKRNITFPLRGDNKYIRIPHKSLNFTIATSL